MALHHLKCSAYLSTDWKMIFKCITNPVWDLGQFLKRRVDWMLDVTLPNTWNYVHTLLNPSDFATREDDCKNSESEQLWFKGPNFLFQNQVDPKTKAGTSNVSVIKKAVERTLDKSEEHS